MPEDPFQKVANKNSLKEADLPKVETKGKQIVLSMVGRKIYAGGKIYAVDEICTHLGGQ